MMIIHAPNAVKGMKTCGITINPSPFPGLLNLMRQAGTEKITNAIYYKLSKKGIGSSQ
jgi:hypothetical protein